MIVCSFCNKENRVNAKFCRSCGRQIESLPISAKSPNNSLDVGLKNFSEAEGIITMSNNQWEYCMLWIMNPTAHKKGAFLGIGGESQGWGYDSGIIYISTSGERFNQEFTEAGEIVDFNPFNKVMGLLGGMGWELVSLQHGNLAMSGGDVRQVRSSTLILNNAVAYFKRPVLFGRAVNEPKLIWDVNN